MEEDENAYMAKIGDKYYTLSAAITYANSATEDVTISLLHDFYLAGKLTLNNTNGKTITFDGGGHAITYLATDLCFSIQQKGGRGYRVFDSLK